MRTVLLLLAVVPTVLFAQNMRPNRAPESLPKNAWEWTVEERLADRFDPGKIQARNREDRSAMSKATSTEAAPAIPAADDRLVIDGAKNPELFLPWELVNRLLRGGLARDVETRTYFRGSYATEIRSYGWDESTFWKDFEKVGSSYADLLARHAQLRAQAQREPPVRRRALEQEAESLRPSMVCVRADVLRRARARWPDFDRFLYTVVAVSFTMSTTMPSVEQQNAMRRYEEPCK